MPNTEDELLDAVASLQKRLDDVDAQLRKMWTLHGLPSWKAQEKQRRQSQATKLPFVRTAAFGETSNQKPLAD